MNRPLLALLLPIAVGCGGTTASRSATAEFALASAGGYSGPTTLRATGDGSVFLANAGSRRTLTIRSSTQTLTIEFTPTGGSQNLTFAAGSASRASYTVAGGTWIATSGTFSIAPALGTTSFYTADLGFSPDPSVPGNTATGTFTLSGTGDLRS